jgi:hypothetical protein
MTDRTSAQGPSTSSSCTGSERAEIELLQFGTSSKKVPADTERTGLVELGRLAARLMASTAASHRLKCDHPVLFPHKSVENYF